MALGRLLCLQTSSPVSSFTSWRHLHMGVAARVLPGHQLPKEELGIFPSGVKAHGFSFKNKT